MTEIRHAVAGRVSKFLGDGNSRSCTARLTDETTDQMGDIVVAAGCKLDNFRNNSVALFNHDPDMPIGNWSSVTVGNKEITGTLTFPPVGTSARADEVCGLVKAGVLRGVSIGFRPIAYEPIKGAGLKFTSWSLLEASIVSIPANPSALVTQRRLARAQTRGERMVQAAELTMVRHLLESGCFTLEEAEHFARKHAPRGNCERRVSEPCLMKDPRNCVIHRGAHA